MAGEKSKWTSEFMEPRESLRPDVPRLAERLGRSQKFQDYARDALFKAGIDVKRTDGPAFYELDMDGNLKTSQVKFGTDQFWDMVQKGKLLAYPAGEKKPVQIQCPGETIALSKPITELPVPPQPSPPWRMSGWHRFLNAVTFGRAYRAERQLERERALEHSREVEAREDAIKARDQFRKDTEAIAQERTDDKLKAEAKSFEEGQTQWEVERMTRENPPFDLDEYRLRYQELTGPKPVIRREWIGRGSDKFYTQEQADSLQTYELPQDKGLGGTVITDQEFSALSMMACCADDLAGEFWHNKNPDASVEENRALNFTMWTDTMVYYKDTPRPSNGHVLPEMYQPARARVDEAIREYHDKGDPSKLGQIIAGGIKPFLEFGTQPPSNSRFLATVGLAGECVALMDRDPKLKEAAMAVKGKDGKPLISEKDLEVGRGLLKAQELNRRNEKAKIMLKADAEGVVKLSPEERKGYIKERTQFTLANEVALNDVKDQTNSKEFKAGRDALSERLTALSIEMVNNKANKEKLAQLQKQVDKTSASFNSYDQAHLRLPQVYTALGTQGEKAMDTLMKAHLPDAEKLYNLSSKEAEATLTSGSLMVKAPDKGQKDPKVEGKETQVQQPKVEERQKENKGPNVGG